MKRTMLLVGILFFVIQVGLLIALSKRGFLLSTWKTLAPAGAYLAIMLAYVALVLIVTRPFLMESLHIPTAGMSPTLEPGNRIIVNKLINPRRFDVVVYWNQANQPLMFCKRLIGLPGERLRFEQGNLHVNDQTVDMPSILAGRCSAAIRDPRGRVHYSDGETIVLGPDEYFFIGDNVELSADSRTYGPTKAKDIVGTVDLVYWPLNKARILR